MDACGCADGSGSPTINAPCGHRDPSKVASEVVTALNSADSAEGSMDSKPLFLQSKHGQF